MKFVRRVTRFIPVSKKLLIQLAGLINLDDVMAPKNKAVLSMENSFILSLKTSE